MRIEELATPALVIDSRVLESNLETMRRVRPGDTLRPHVKAHKCTRLAGLQYDLGHIGFTCATVRECLGIIDAGLGNDILLANEVIDAARLRSLSAHREIVTIAVDSAATAQAAANAGLKYCVIDVNVGLRRCGIEPSRAAGVAETARSFGLEVRGVMGYEGHLMLVQDRVAKKSQVEYSMELLRFAHDSVGGSVVSAGGTGTFDLHDGTGVTEVQAGSYALMDTTYGALDLPFGQATHVLGTVISVSSEWAVADIGLKALGMDRGLPSVNGGRVLSCSDEHLTFVADARLSTGERVWVVPAHIDPTMALHTVAWLHADGHVVDRWPIDLRGW